MSSTSAKQLIQAAVAQLPDDATFEDAMERLYFLAKVERGREAADRGELVSHEEARQRLLGE